MSGLATLEVDAQICSPLAHCSSMTVPPVIAVARPLVTRTFLEIL
jgi:hypothetical protein